MEVRSWHAGSTCKAGELSRKSKEAQTARLSSGQPLKETDRERKGYTFLRTQKSRQVQLKLHGRLACGDSTWVDIPRKRIIASQKRQIIQVILFIGEGESTFQGVIHGPGDTPTNQNVTCPHRPEIVL